MICRRTQTWGHGYCCSLSLCAAAAKKCFYTSDITICSLSNILWIAQASVSQSQENTTVSFNRQAPEYIYCPLLTLDPSFNLGPKRACAVHVLPFIIFKDNTPFYPSAQFVSGRIVKKQENLLNPALFSRSSKITSCCSFFCMFFPYVATGKCWWKRSCRCFRAKC